MAALGVVFGDIGTSPLYTIEQCFSDFTGLQPTPHNVLGILSLITWALIVVVTLKYVVVVMRADNDGEGGVLALMALVSRQAGVSERSRNTFLVIGMIGAALFYGDCLLTPAISVLSAVDGISVATPEFARFVLPIAVVVIVCLFAMQRVGTASVGRLFGPVMLLWFVVLIVLGAHQIIARPEVLAALSPHYAARFAITHPFVTFVALGAVTLAFTGAEALYADMGHFGRDPIRRAWLGLVLPALLVNYYGQGALLLADPAAIDNTFFRLAPHWALYPLVALATMATIIASQATISGAFSMAQQAALLGISSRLRVLHTSASEFGQIYVPAVNWMMLAGVVLIMLEFKTSDALAAAYGIAVTGTMLMTTLLVFSLALRGWKWGWPAVVLVMGGFLVIDIALFSANMLKFLDGGWMPLAIATGILATMWAWRRGRKAAADGEAALATPLQQLVDGIAPGRVHRATGTAVYLTSQKQQAPTSLRDNLRFNEVLHQHVVVLTVEVSGVPSVEPKDRLQLVHLGKGVHRVTMHYGFMEQPNVPDDLAPIVDKGVPIEPATTTYFTGRTSFIAAEKSTLTRWEQQLFLALSKVSTSPGDFFGLPANRVVELGSRIKI
jgi:KUP system potassium uptake protein